MNTPAPIRLRKDSSGHAISLTENDGVYKVNVTTMHFTIERQRLLQMLESVRRKVPGQKKKQKDVRLFACAARVFVEANGVTAGSEALVLRDGGCLQPLEQFLALIKSYPDKENVTIEADPRALRMFTSTRSVSGFTTEVKPPADFIVGKVTDTWVSGDAHQTSESR